MPFALCPMRYACPASLCHVKFAIARDSPVASEMVLGRSVFNRSYPVPITSDTRPINL